MADKTSPLAAGTQLENYIIKSTLSSGGFGMVYLATNAQDQSDVVIKEYMPGKLARRLDDNQVIAFNNETAKNLAEGRKLFLQEANILLKLHHANIVHAHRHFDTNNTTYMVMDYEPGKNLLFYIQKHQGKLSEDFLRTVFPAILDALRLVHGEGLLHLDIKPGNIHIQQGGQPILLDFGSVQRLQMSRRYQPTTVLSHGYSPVEQYDPSGYIGPWTDIYALGATMRACMDGQTPPAATERREKDKLRPAVSAFKRKYKTELLQAIDWSMEVNPELRPQSVDELLDAINKNYDPEAANRKFFKRIANFFS